MYGSFGVRGVFVVSAGLALLWLLTCRGMQFPMNMTRKVIPVGNLNQAESDALAEKIRRISGVEEVTMAPDEGEIYLKVNKSRYQPNAVADLLK